MTIQQEIKTWREKKFPYADIWDIYKKLLEEVGELAEAIRRYEQVNRNGFLPPFIIHKKENAILELGDIGVVLSGIADKLGIDLIEAIKLSHNKNLRRENGITNKTNT